MNRRDFLKLLPLAPFAVGVVSQAKTPKPDTQKKYPFGRTVFWQGRTFAIRDDILVWADGLCVSIPEDVGDNWWYPGPDCQIKGLCHSGDDLMCICNPGGGYMAGLWRLRADPVNAPLPFIAELVWALGW